MKPPRLLIEDWLPAAAIGVECMRERGSASALAPHTYLHVWWARRPLTASRAAVLGSLLPANFPHDQFERLLGFWGSSRDLLNAQHILDFARQVGSRVENPHGPRAFKKPIREDDLAAAHTAASKMWGKEISVIDPMAGGGSIPFESARLGFHTLANEYNSVACSVLEATVDYPFRFGVNLAQRAREWGRVLSERFNARMERYFPKTGPIPSLCYIFARTVPCPETHHPTPLVPDWHLLNPKSGLEIVAEPQVDKVKGTWRVRIREIGTGAGQVSKIPAPTYSDAKGVSLFTSRQIPADYIKAKAQAGEMKSALYAVAIKTPQGLRFAPPEQADLKAIELAEKELVRLRPLWEKENLVPTERIPEGDQPGNRLVIGGIDSWAKMFAPRQLLGLGILVEELRKLRTEISKKESQELGEAVEHMLAIAVDKFASHNCILARFESTRQAIKSIFGRHGYEFHCTHAEMAPCGAGSGLEWAIENVLDAYEQLCALPRNSNVRPVSITLGSATSLPHLNDGSMSVVVVDPPYDDNVQYAELANFFYVWLKRTQGHRHPDWFSTYLCDHDQEAVVNRSRHRDEGAPKEARTKARAFYRRLMTESFIEAKRILRDDGALTVMFTHKKQEAWEALFSALIESGFTITATWPVKTESEHSLHQAKKNAAQSTVILVARKRERRAGIGYWDEGMKEAIRNAARSTAERLSKEGLNPVDQLVGSFGPAIEVYSRFDEVRTDTGVKIGVDKAIDEASDAVSKWRIEQLAARGLDRVEPEGRFALLCWDVLGAAEFRFNEAKLLGHAVGMDVASLEAAGLVLKSGDKIKMLSAKERRRNRALAEEEVVETLFGPVKAEKKRTKKDALKVHPNDPQFRTALDACHALALRYLEAGGGSGGIGSARGLARQQRWNRDSNEARLMEALVRAAPIAVRFDKGKKSAGALFPEFRAWHALLEPLFGVVAPEWKEVKPAQGILFNAAEEDDEEGDDSDEEAEE